MEREWRKRYRQMTTSFRRDSLKSKHRMRKDVELLLECTDQSRK